MIQKSVLLLTDMNNTKSRRLSELDALRGLAALLVVFFHFTMLTEYRNLPFKYGCTGIDLFFIISGFVIFMSLNKVNTSLDFIINRISRLYPTYWTCVTFTYVLMCLLKQAPDITQYLANMTMFQFYLRSPDIDGPYWTMIIEMIFYVCIVFLFHFGKIRFINLFGIGTVLLSLIAAALYNHKPIDYVLRVIPFLQFVPLFFSGILFYKIYTENQHRLERYLLLLFCFAAQVYMFPVVGRAHFYVSQKDYLFCISAYYLLFTLFVNNKLQFIVNPVTLFFGKISFALYLIHQFVSKEIILPYLLETLHLSFFLACLICTVIVIGLASLVTFYIEAPAINNIKFKLHRLIEFMEIRLRQFNVKV